MASKGLLAVRLAAGAALCFCALQMAMISSCTPGAAWPAATRRASASPASSLIDDASTPFTRRRHRRLVRNLATSALLIGVLVAFPALPTCPAAVAGAWGADPVACGDCFPFARATLRRVNVVAAAALAVCCASVYIILTYLNPAGNGEASDGGAPRRPRGRDLRE